MKINFSKSVIVLAFITIFSGCVLLTQANTVYGANVLQFDPQVPIPGMQPQQMDVGSEVNGVMTSDLLSKYIAAIYNYGLLIASILATVVLMGAGVLWLTSAGNESKITQAKDLIAGSITGMIILFSAWMLLNTINPELLKLRPIKMMTVPEIKYACCESGGIAYMIETNKCKGTLYEDSIVNYAANKCEKFGCCFRDTFTAGVKRGYCLDTIASKCKTNATFKTGTKCSALADCKKTFVDQFDCTGRNEEKCANSGSIIATCYSGMCYISPSKQDEPCGNEGGHCYTKAECTGGRGERDWVGGNNCDTGLVCCVNAQIW